MMVVLQNSQMAVRSSYKQKMDAAQPSITFCHSNLACSDLHVSDNIHTNNMAVV